MTKATPLSDPTPVTLLGLTVRDFNRIELAMLEFDPDGGLVRVAGRNGQGKSSALDALAWAFGGPRAVPDTENPIRHGAKSASVIVETSEFVLERRQTPSGNRFVVTAPDGAERKTPQAALDAMFNALTFDPLAFAKMKPAEQRAALIRALRLEDKLAQIDTVRNRAFQERTIAGRELKTVSAQFAELAEPDMFDPQVEVSAADIVSEIRKAQALAQSHANWAQDVTLCEGKVRSWKQHIAKLEADLVAAKENLIELQADVDGAVVQRDAITVPDVDALQSRLDKVEAVNRKARAAQAWRSKKHDVDAAQKVHDELTLEIEAADAARDELLAGARLPIAGLKLEDDGLSLNGVPLGQASTAETIVLGTIVAIALRPNLHVLRIAEGSLLDGETRAAIDALAREHGFLVLAEMVGDEPSGTADEIWIEDGRTVAN